MAVNPPRLGGGGLRYDDPAIAIAWPAAPRVIARADLGWPALSERQT
jgi:dTDP-4-dehydrorhamnose 3,5-epimerase-like enzyme